MLKTLTVDGIEHLVVLERSSDDGGLLVCYLCPDDDGAHLAKREWFQDPSLAKQVFDAADDRVLREKSAEVKEMFPKVKA